MAGNEENNKEYSFDRFDRIFIGIGAPEAKENFRFPTLSAEWVTGRFFRWNGFKTGVYVSYGETDYEDALGILQNRYRSHLLLEIVKNINLNKTHVQIAASSGLRIENTAYASDPGETIVHSKDYAYGYSLKVIRELSPRYGFYIEQRISSAPREIFWNGNNLSLGLTFKL